MTFDERLKKDLKEKLIAFLNKKTNKSDFIDMDLFNTMVEVTAKSGFEVAVIIDKQGIIVDVFVGDKTSVSIPSPDYSGIELNGLRVVHTHPNGDSTLSQLDKSMLKNNRYDSVCAIGVNNSVSTTASAGFINPEIDGVDIINVHNALYINKYGLMEKIQEVSAILKRKNTGVYDNSVVKDKAILVMAEIDKFDHIERDLKELEGLAKTADILVLDKLSQKRAKPDGRYLIGEGKLVELKHMVQNTGANLVIFDNELTGSKINNLSTEIGVKVITRSMLILDIFAKRAQSREGKLQVELAQLKYLLPRINSFRNDNDSGSGVGLRGPGESKIEINRRIVEENIQKKERELNHVKKNREVTRSSRRRTNKKIVSLVGYTNSGKSTLMNNLAKANVYEKDELFATLDTTTRNVYINEENEILLIDTVGFINKLPHEFINAFSSTLEESVNADLLIHVVDLSNPEYLTQMKVVEEVLDKIGANSKMLVVFNKIDKVIDFNEENYTCEYDHVFVSAKKDLNIANLKAKLVELIN